jgi:DNA repair photolyase
LGQPGDDERRPHAGVAAGRGWVGGPDVRRPRGAWDPLSRGAGEVRPQPSAEEVANAVPLDDQPVPWLHTRLRLTRVYCFARPTHAYLDLNAREDFEREIVVKVNVPELLRAELARPGWNSEHVALGTNTDPYQWVESRYRLMEGIWEAMRDFANPCSILTKSPLLLRDIDLLKEISARTEFVANLSIPTLEEKAWRATEPHTPHPRKRIEAVAELNRAGIQTGVLIAPLMPGINDSPAQVEKLLGELGEAGAGSVGGIGLHLRGEVRDIWFDWLRQYRPDLVPRYEALFSKGAYMRADERARLAKLARGSSSPRRFRAARGPDAEPVANVSGGAGRHARPRQATLF